MFARFHTATTGQIFWVILQWWENESAAPLSCFFVPFPATSPSAHTRYSLLPPLHNRRPDSTVTFWCGGGEGEDL